MSRKANILSYIITMVATLGTLFAAVLISDKRFGGDMLSAVLKFSVGAVIAGLVHTLAHELGHLVAGKRNGFKFSSMTVWFFKWSRVRKKIRFDFVMLGEEAGYTEMVPTNSENMEIKLKKMTMGGIWASLIFMLVGVPALFIVDINVWIYSIWVMFLPIGAYYFFGSLLPASSGGIRNDGGVLYGIRKNDDVSKVTVNMLKVQAELFNGKTPSEVDENLYFDLPQLPEDNPCFAMLLSARYAYYLDKEDYDNAKKMVDRMMSIVDYMPKAYEAVIKTDALYNACTFDYDEEKADDLVYELEKYLNNVNTATNVRAKMAYLLYVKREIEPLGIFYKKGVKEADRCLIKGLGAFERKLFEKMKQDY